jgi:hypothetical protein
MYRTFVGVSLLAGALMPAMAMAEMQTTKIGDQTVAFVVTPPQRGAALTKEELLERFAKAKPANIVLPTLPSQSEQPR